LVGKAAVFDIITQDMDYGPIAAGAEIISLANDVLNAFPNLGNSYVIRVSHSSCALLSLPTR
jgi:eukaryotic translation initiation factor 2-alpha kinase 4